MVYSLGFWVISARKWFTGPVQQIAGKSSKTYPNELSIHADLIL